MYHLGVDACAVVCGKELIGICVTVAGCQLINAFEGGVDLCALILVQLDAIGCGVIAESGGLDQALACRIKEIILPGTFGKSALLFVQSLRAVGGIQTEHGSVAAVLADKGVVLACIFIVDLGGVILGIAHGESCSLVEDVGVEQNDKGDRDDNGDGADRPAALALCSFLCFLFSGKGLLVSAGFACGLTQFLFG